MRSAGLLIIFHILFSGTVLSQTVFSNSAPSVKWKYLENDRFRLIYPESFSDQAPRYASLLDTLHTLESRSLLNGNPKKVSMIIRNGSALSNGFVTLAPRRSEIFTMPPQDYNFVGTNDWLDKVIIHEYRHVVQFDQSRRGFNKILSGLFGQSAWAGMAFASAPQWFWEGDAVLAETVFTRSGRGRITGYNREFRTNTLTQFNSQQSGIFRKIWWNINGYPSLRKYKYEKQLLGSYKDFVPNHYVLGNFMVPYVRKKTNDPLVWNKVTSRSFSTSFLPFSFSSSLKKATGKGVRDTYNEMIDGLENKWREDLDPKAISDYKQKVNYTIINTQRKKVFTDYNYPLPLPDGTIITQKEGLGDIQRFYRVSSEGEDRIFTPGIVNNTGMLSASQNKLVWTEYNFHPRWRNESYSVIKLYDMESRKLSQLGFQTRYSGADINQSGILVVTTETDKSYRHSIVLLDLSGNVISKWSYPENSFFSHVRFSGANELVALRTNSEGKSLVLIDTDTHELTTLIGPGRENLGNPVSVNDWVFYSSSITGIDNIYAINRNSRERYKVTESQFGAYFPMPSADGKHLYYSEMGELGLDLVRIDINSENWIPFTQTGYYSNPLYSASVEQEGVIINSGDLPQMESLEERDYGPMKGLLNIHSWGPFVSTSGASDFDIGIFSRDIMSTASLFAGYNFDVEELTGRWKGEISYQRFLPVFDLEFTSGDRSINRIVNVADQNDPPDFQNFNFTWNEDILNLGVRIPLLLTRSKFLTSMEIGYEFAYTGVSNFGNDFNTNTSRYFYDLLGDGSLKTNTFSAFIINTLKTSKRDVKTRFGQFLSIESTGSFSSDYDAGQTAVRTRWWFPGIGKHHSLSGFWVYQNRKVNLEQNNYYLRNRVEVPRGVAVSTFQNFYSMGINYELPILYPDVHLGPFLYFQRIRLTGFFDYGYGSTSVPQVNNFFVSREYYSTGAELRLDFNAARLLPQIHMGVRYAYDLQLNTGMIELIFPTIDL